MESIFQRVARLLQEHLTRQEFIQFGNELDADATNEFNDAVDARLLIVAPEVFGQPEEE